MTAQTLWYTSGIQLGNVMLPAYPNAVFDVPPDWVAPSILGNYWRFNVGETLLTPMVTLSLAIRNAPDAILRYTGSAVGGGLLDYLLLRTSDVSHDTYSPGNLTFWDGRTRMTLAGTKVDSMVLSSRKGDDINCMVRFCGADFAFDNVDPGFSQWSDANILRFNALNFASPLANIVWSFTLSFSNNHTPDLALNGTRVPVACNASMQDCSMEIMVQSADSMSNSNYGPVANGGAISLLVSNSTTVSPSPTRTLTLQLPRVVNQTPHNRAITPPRVMKSYVYQGLGLTGKTVAPLICTGSSNF